MAAPTSPKAKIPTVSSGRQYYFFNLHNINHSNHVIRIAIRITCQRKQTKKLAEIEKPTTDNPTNHKSTQQKWYSYYI